MVSGRSALSVIDNRGTILTELNTSDESLRRMFWDCTDNYDLGALSSELIVYEDGMIWKRCAAPPPRVSRNELALYKTILAELTARFTQDIGMGSEGDSVFRPFYIAAQVEEEIPTAITPELI